VARDRQRAKQRRRRQPGAGGTGPGPARARAREAGVEPEPADTVFPQRGDVEPVEPVEPIEAEEQDSPRLDTEAESAPVEDEAVIEERRERREPRGRAGIITFLGHVVDELRRVQWPDRRHVGQGTAVVLGFVVIAGSYLGLLDALLKPLIEAIL
jgi:preprotein translocase SecE subunit